MISPITNTNPAALNDVEHKTSQPQAQPQAPGSNGLPEDKVTLTSVRGDAAAGDPDHDGS